MALDAARSGDVALLEPMLQAGMPVNLADEKGNSLLMLASYHGNLGATKLLLDHGADPEKRNHRDQTPLAGVAFKGNLDAVKLLVERGANPFSDQGGGRFPIQFAALFGHMEIVRYLESVSPTGRAKRLEVLAAVTAAVRSFIGLFCLRRLRHFVFVIGA
jgi:ankyrin repeat protein